jgi:hypothetical protein
LDEAKNADAAKLIAKCNALEAQLAFTKVEHSTSLRKAAEIIGEFFSMVIAAELREEGGRRFLYSHEEDALTWISQQWKRDPETSICMWTAHYARLFQLHQKRKPGNVSPGNPDINA